MKRTEQKIKESYLVHSKEMKVIGNVIHNVAVLGPRSSNGKGRDYTEQYHESARPKYEGIVVAPDHPSKNNPRSSLDALGKLTGLYTEVKDDGPHTYAKKWIINPKHPRAEQILWAAEHMPETMGLSHDVFASGVIDKSTGRFKALECKQANEVALVGKAGTNKNLFEQLDESEEYKQFQLDVEAENRIVKKILLALESQKGNEMELKDITAQQLIEARPELVKQLITESTQSAEQKAQHDADMKELGELREAKKRTDDIESAKKLCEELKLPAEKVSDAFISAIVSQKTVEEKTALIEDRKTLIGVPTIKSKSKTAGQQTAKNVKENQQTSGAGFDQFKDNKQLKEALFNQG